MKDTWNRLKLTDYARLSVNPLRKLQFDRKVGLNPNKTPITLQLGDPTLFGNFPPAKETVEAFRKALDSDTFLYNPGHGRMDALKAVAEYSQNRGNITADDVILTSGCGHAFEMCILSLAAPGDNLLVPFPCFSYRTFTDGSGIVTKGYSLDPTKDWEVDLEHMESLIDEKTRAIIVTHPGNPCGNVFSKKHILEILEIAERHRLPIISDEVYEYLVHPGVEYHPVASLSENVPVLTCSGLTKRFLVPGIRMGWIIVSDRHNVLEDFKEGFRNITGRLLGPNSTVQLALPEILRNTPQKFFDDTNESLAHHAKIAYKLLKKAPGLSPIMPSGALYMMIKIEMEKFPKFSTCLEFSEALIREQSVLLYPGVPCFNFPGFIRIVLTVPEDLIIEACGRIKEFCENHIKF